MSPDDHLSVELPSDFLAESVAQLLDRVFPQDDESRQLISDRLDLRANPDLPDIYAVLIAVCDEWRDWRCALVVSAGRDHVGLDTPAAHILQQDEGTPVLQLRLEQEYRALDYAIQHDLWASRDELLGWMRSLVALYFLDKHEATLAAPPPLSSGPALVQALRDLEAHGIIATQSPDDGDGSEVAEPGEGVYAVTREGRRLIAGLLTETESYIDQFDHYQDALFDPDADLVEFATGRGVDLRVEVFMAEGLDPVRTVFLLRLYDGTLDARVRDWVDALESEELFEGLLEPVVNRNSVSAEVLATIIDHGYAWLGEQRERARREEEDRDLLRRAGGGAPPPPDL